MLLILTILALASPALSQFICCTPDLIEFDFHQHVTDQVEGNDPTGDFYVSHVVFDDEIDVYSLTFTEVPEGYPVTRATVDFSVSPAIEYIELTDGSCVQGEPPVVIDNCIPEGSDPVAADPFTINGDVTAQLYHHPVIENMMDRWAAVTTSDCEPIYDSNAYFGTDYLGRAMVRFGANTYMNYKDGIDDPSELDIPADCTLYSAKQMKSLHEIYKVK